MLPYEKTFSTYLRRGYLFKISWRSYSYSSSVMMASSTSCFRRSSSNRRLVVLSAESVKELFTTSITSTSPVISS